MPLRDVKSLTDKFTRTKKKKSETAVEKFAVEVLNAALDFSIVKTHLLVRN